MCDATFCLWHFKAGGISVTLGLLLGASSVSSLGRNFSFSGCSVPVLLYPFHQEVLLLLPESFLLQVGPVPTQPWKLSGSLSLQQPFMHFTLALFLS